MKDHIRSFSSRSDFATTLISTINAGELDGGSTERFNHFRSAGIFTSHNLSYDDTYLASFLVRQDYASVLGSLTSSIVYPAGSVAVRWDKFDWVPEVFSILQNSGWPMVKPELFLGEPTAFPSFGIWENLNMA